MTSITNTNSYYDGGKGRGIVVWVGPFTVWLIGTGPDEPDAEWSVSWEQATYHDHMCWLACAPFFTAYPALPDKQIKLNANLQESSIEGSVTVGGVDSFLDGICVILGAPHGTTLTKRTRIARCTPSTTSGEGGVRIAAPPSGSLIPTFAFEDSEWVANVAGSGPAVFVVFGQADIRFVRCIFRENVAAQSGGAISVLGPPTLSLKVQGSIFQTNSVQPPSDAEAVDLTVRLNTGSFLIDPDTDLTDPAVDTYIPIWRIDEGAVHGISADLCERARQSSLTAVTKGFPASFPSDLACANVSYAGPGKSYNHVVSLAAGAHTLHTGLMVESTLQVLGWLQAWIEIVDTIAPIFPALSEIRAEQFPGCYFTSCGGGQSSCCPGGMAMWSSQEFQVTLGKGGAIDTAGPIVMSISDTVFRENVAAKGAALSIAAANSVRITNTTMDTPGSAAVWMFAAAVEDCSQNPCELGSKCTFKDFSTFCEVCGPNEIGADGVECSACSSGTQPNELHTLCLTCEPGQYSQIGLCNDCAAGKTNSNDFTVCAPCEPGTSRSAEEASCAQCPAGSQPNSGKTACERCTGKNSFSADGRECRDCPARNAPNDERTACFCQFDTYSAADLGTLVTCHGTSFRSDGVDTDECAVCPACLDCDTVGQTMLRSGWAFFGTGEAYQCPGWNKDFEACPALLLNESTTMDRGTCAVGYEGPVCGNCQPEYNHLKVGNPCDPCDDGVINVGLVLGLFCGALIVGGAVISGALGVLQDFGVITDLRILVGFYQILGQAGNVLDLEFPYPVPELVDFIKLLFLDVRKVVKLDCWNIGGFYGKIITNIVVVPLVLVGVCVLIYLSQRKTLLVVIAAGASDTSGLEVLKVKLKQNLFLGIFLVYPTITATLFRVPQCQYFGDAGFHEDDYTIDCSTTKFALTVAFAVLVILLIPIGVPAIFTLLMLRKKASLGGVVNETALGGAKLVADDADDESDSYGFLIKDYRPQYWYHEIVTYSRKLLLGGISVVMGRGTMAQTYFVISAEAFYLMHHMRTYPFVIYKHNVIEALGHCALMLLYAISLILRNDDQDDWRAEWFPKQGYGWFIVFIFAIVLPSPTMYFFRKDSASSESGSLGEGFEENPLAIEMGQAVAEDENAGDASESKQTGKPARAKLAKMQREAKDARTQNQQLVAQVQQLQTQVQQLEVQSQTDVQEQQADKDALRAEIERLRARLSGVAAPESNQLIATPGNSDAAASPPTDVASTGDAAMRTLVADESLSEDTRESAQKALDELVATQIEQTKREQEQGSTLQKLQSEAQFIRQQAEAEQTKAKAQAVAKATKPSEELMGWLERHRLQVYAADLVLVAGSNAAPSDLQYLTDEDIEQLGAAMTRVERLRLRDALQAEAVAEAGVAAGTE